MERSLQIDVLCIYDWGTNLKYVLAFAHSTSSDGMVGLILVHVLKVGIKRRR